MSTFPALDALRALCFPQGIPQAPDPSLLQRVSSLIAERVMTRPRETARTLRHPQNQAGLVLEEDGSCVLRAGHALYDHNIGATLTLRADGSVVVTAPGGLLLSAPVATTDSPTEALCMGGLRFNQDWESARVGQIVDPLLLETLFVAPGPGVPATVPLSAVLSSNTLYQSPGN